MHHPRRQRRHASQQILDCTETTIVRPRKRLSYGVALSANSFRGAAGTFVCPKPPRHPYRHFDVHVPRIPPALTDTSGTSPSPYGRSTRRNRTGVDYVLAKHISLASGFHIMIPLRARMKGPIDRVALFNESSRELNLLHTRSARPARLPPRRPAGSEP